MPTIKPPSVPSPFLTYNSTLSVPDLITTGTIKPLWPSFGSEPSASPLKKFVYSTGASSSPKAQKPKGPVNNNKTYNKTLLEAFSFLRPKQQDGEIGMEIECEGMNLFGAPISWWQTHVDHSLRPYKDHPPIEYVLRKPITREQVPKALSYLSKKLKEVGSEVVDSHRTSVHVHVNCQTLTMKQVIQYVCMYVVFEEMLVRFSGPDREGNLFCLRAKDAEHWIQILEQGLQQDDYDDIFNKELRYTACNTASLGKFASLEFRSMRGTVDQGLIQLWVDILLLLRDKALEYSDPQEIVKDFEALGPVLFLKKVTASRPDIHAVLNAYPEKHQMMWDGLRLMRDVAYAIKWEPKDDRLVEKKDPQESQNLNLSPNLSLSDDFEPQCLKPGVWLEFENDAFWLKNYNEKYTEVTFHTPWGLSPRFIYKADPLNGKYLNMSDVMPHDAVEPGAILSIEDEPDEDIDSDSEPEPETYYDEPTEEEQDDTPY